LERKAEGDGELVELRVVCDGYLKESVFVLSSQIEGGLLMGYFDFLSFEEAVVGVSVGGFVLRLGGRGHGGRSLVAWVCL
jgi:hypothetical protein